MSEEFVIKGFDNGIISRLVNVNVLVRSNTMNEVKGNSLQSSAILGNA